MEARSADAVMVCSMLKPRLWHANPTETRDTRTSCGRIGQCSNPRPNNHSGWALGFGLIADRAMGTIRAINPHHRRMAQRIAPSNQSNQSFLRSFGRTNSANSIGRGIVGGIPIGPMNATNGGPQLALDGLARSSPAESWPHVERFGRARIANQTQTGMQSPSGGYCLRSNISMILLRSFPA